MLIIICITAYVLGFICIPILVVSLEKEYPGCMKVSSNGMSIFESFAIIAFLWPIMIWAQFLIAISYFYEQGKLK